MIDIPAARATVAGHLRKRAAAMMEAADRIEAGQDDAWGVQHEIKRMEADDGAMEEIK